MESNVSMRLLRWRQLKPQPRPLILILTLHNHNHNHYHKPNPEPWPWTLRDKSVSSSFTDLSLRDPYNASFTESRFGYWHFYIEKYLRGKSISIPETRIGVSQSCGQDTNTKMSQRGCNECLDFSIETNAREDLTKQSHPQNVTWGDAIKLIQGAGTCALFGDSPLPGPLSFTGGGTVKVTAEVHHPIRGKSLEKVALDTQSDVTTRLREYLFDIHLIRSRRRVRCRRRVQPLRRGDGRCISTVSGLFVSVALLGVPDASRCPLIGPKRLIPRDAVWLTSFRKHLHVYWTLKNIRVHAGT
jgi:hypothetical protein